MEQIILRIPKTSDRFLVEFFRELSETHTLSVVARILSGIDLTRLPTGEDDYGWAAILEWNSALILRLNVSIGGVAVNYYRNGRTPEQATIFDEVMITYNPQAGEVPADERLRIFAAINSKLKAFDPNASLITSNTAANNHLEALHQSTLNRLEALSEEIIRKGIETHTRLEADFAAKRQLQEERLTEVKAELARQHEEELKKLRAAQARLDVRIAEIDDRGNTHARREIRNSMLNDVKARIENFGVSDLTSAKRAPVAKGLIGLCAVFLFLCATTSFEIFQAHSSPTMVSKNGLAQNAKSTEDIQSQNLVAPPVEPKAVIVEHDRASIFYLWVRLSLLSAALVATLLYYIRWQNRWAEQHAASEFQLQQFYIDVNRANWVIESGLEWRKETNAEMPEIVLTSITKNLFSAANEVPPVLHPADELASALLGSASRLKLKAGNSEIEYDKPGNIPKS